MFQSFLSYSKRSLMLLLIGIVFILIVLYYNGTHGIYLFDTSIVYYYGYLLNKGYTPFNDFITPLLPFAGMVQMLFYKIFGLNYISGVYAAMTVTTIQFIFIFHILTKLKIKENSTFFYTLLITLASLPCYGTIYYNHLMIAFLSMYVVISIYIYQNLLTGVVSKPIKEYTYVICQYLLIAIIFLVKIQLGAFLLVSTSFMDLILRLKLTNNNISYYIKALTIRAIVFIVPIALIIYSTKADITQYLAYLKNISLVKNLAFDRIKGFFELPFFLDSSILLSPTLLYLLFMLYAYHHIPKLFSAKSLVPIFVATNIYMICIILVINSTETLALLTSLMVLILLTAEVFMLPDASNTAFHKVLKPGFFCVIFAFTFVFAIFSVRKSVNENTSQGYPITYESNNTFFFDESTPDLMNFFDKIGVNESQYSNFLAMDSVISKNKTKKIFFGPELEMFNIVYKTQPIKPWPVWVHPYLTVTDEDYGKMGPVLAKADLDIIVLSRMRVGFFPKPMIDFLNEKYELVPTSSSWILILKRKIK